MLLANQRACKQDGNRNLDGGLLEVVLAGGLVAVLTLGSLDRLAGLDDLGGLLGPDRLHVGRHRGQHLDEGGQGLEGVLGRHVQDSLHGAVVDRRRESAGEVLAPTAQVHLTADLLLGDVDAVAVGLELDPLLLVIEGDTLRQ